MSQFLLIFLSTCVATVLSTGLVILSATRLVLKEVRKQKEEDKELVREQTQALKEYAAAVKAQRSEEDLFSKLTVKGGFHNSEGNS